MTRTNLFPKLTIIATGLFLALLLLLHFLKPEIALSWRVISEYQIGDFGWLMSVAFFSFAVGSMSLFVALRPHLRNGIGRIGLWLLPVTVFGITLGAIFPTDPITTARDAFSTAGTLHNLGGLFSVLMFPFVAAFITWGLARIPSWKNVRSWIILLATTVWLSLVWYFTAYYTVGTPGPDALIGYPNRLFIVAYCVWLIVLARQVIVLQADKR